MQRINSQYWLPYLAFTSLHSAFINVENVEFKIGFKMKQLEDLQAET